MELLAPAGNKESLIAAINSGADAIYLSGKKFGARAYALNFSNEELKEAIRIGKIYGVKIYVTMNTLVKENEVEEFLDQVEFLYANGVDAILMQDFGMICLCLKKFPNLEIHASTQAHNVSREGIDFLYKLGVKRVVLPREMSLEEIKQIETPVEKEVFVHGALCVSYSGRCLMSQVLGGRSGNRGECAGCCRFPWKLYKNDKLINEGYLLSMKELNLSEDAIFKINGPLDLTFLMKVYDIEGFDHLKEPKYIPQQPKMLDASRDLFEQIREHDILLHHPYETFDPVVNFVKKAASDPNVLAIKQTLYRVSSHSPIIASLAQAAENGKQVSVLVELKARFDEENNIVWAKKLEKAGCHVIYGLVGLKTHSKITLVVRKEEDEIRRYVHLGTGNYNDSTAKLYTDMGMFTSKTRYGEDATAVFNMLSGYSEPLVWNKLSLAPLWLRGKFLSLIEREKEHAKNGRPARIIAKMNSLCDPGIIEALYDASEAGVEIDLIVRGICCLRAGIKGLSEHIRVRSIVGTFLEHSRIFYFENNGNAEYYMGSADWMPRNLDKRVEILFPVEDPILQEEIYHILHIQLSDTKKAHLLMPDGHYVKVDQRGKTPLNSQLYFCEEAMANAKK